MLLLIPPMPMIDRKTTTLRFVRRIYHLRVLGLGLGSICVGSVLFQNQAHLFAWVVLFCNGFLWPHVAYRLAINSRDPRAAELLNLQIDSAMGGVWIALMQFNLLPCVVIALMLAIDKINVGGWQLLTRALVGQAAACVLTLAVCGLAYSPETSMLNIIATLPFLIAYPTAISAASYSLTKIVREQNQQLSRLSRIDSATGLLARMHWQDVAAQELREFRQGGKAATLLMIDIDHFNSINELHGRHSGDEVIRQVAAIVSSCIRDVDVLGRYGGDEFGLVLVHSDADDASIVAERIRDRIATARFDRQPRLQCTASIGLAQASIEMHDMRAWIRCVDIALSNAKLGGRNRVSGVVHGGQERLLENVPG